MTTDPNTTTVNFSDAAALLLAYVQGDERTADHAVEHMATGTDCGPELAATLVYTLKAASMAIRKDLDAAIEAGEPQSRALEFLVSARSHAHTHARGDSSTG